jgi:TPR repeat protein
MWEEAAKMGHLESMTDLGYIYEKGLKVDGRLIIEHDASKAFEYYSKAAEQNFPRALNNLASLYYSNPQYKNHSKSIGYFERAAEA